MQHKTIMGLLLPCLLGAIGYARSADFAGGSAEKPSLHWANRIHVSGTAELDVRHENRRIGSRVAVNRLALAMDAHINTLASVHAQVLHEDSAGQDVVLDEASITLGNPDTSAIRATIGKVVVPFGRFSTQLLSDPLTQELAEAHEKVVQLTVERGGWRGSGYLFHGDARTDRDDNLLDRFGLAVGYTLSRDNARMDLGVGYISAMEDADQLTEALGLQEAGVTVTDHTSGLAAQAAMMLGPYTLTGEYITALSTLDNQQRPHAWNSELGFAFGLLGKEATLVAGYQGTAEAQFMALPKERLLGGLSVVLAKDTTLGVELSQGELYPSDTGRVIRSKQASLRVAVSF